MSNKGVVGFVFNIIKEGLHEPNEPYVCLIRKRVSESFQSGKLNAIGGSVEKDETEVQAMVRETEEESGMKTNEADWTLVSKMKFDSSYELTVFATIYQDRYGKAISKTDEQIEWIFPNSLWAYSYVSNLSWLMPLCCEKLGINVNCPKPSEIEIF